MCNLGFAMQLVLVIEIKATEHLLQGSGRGRMEHI